MYDFGPLAAQNDHDLLTYFHVTRQANNLLNFSVLKPAFIFVARPGAGKTALLKWLARGAADHLTLVVSAENTRLSSDDASLNPADLRLMISTELATAIISEIAEASTADVQSRRKAKDFVTKGWKDTVAGFFRENLAGLNILGCGFSLKPPERRSYLQKIRRTNRLTQARSLLATLSKEVHVTLLIDDPEFLVGEGLSEITVDNARRVGALLSALAEAHSLGVRVVTFLKEHVLQNTRAHYKDFGHFGGQIEGLEWTADDLVKMLSSRVTTRLKLSWDQVFTVRPDALVDKLFPFLVNGPRDLLSLCNSAGREEGKISLTRLEKGLRAYSAEKWRDLATHYGEEWPGIDRFARAMVEALKQKHEQRPIPVGIVNAEFGQQFANPDSDIHGLRKIDWIDSVKWETPPVDERLFVVGCLGYVFERQRYFPWAGRDVERFRLADSHFVSPAFLQ